MQIFKESPLCQATDITKANNDKTDLSASLDGVYQLECARMSTS